ncbi:MAG TPA: RDD family protein [Candidatus Nanoarchaeia archaeon]|nr:RDD family protein [Candidatus Nanoarchaeia archaeon]
MAFKNLLPVRKAPLWRRAFAYVIDLVAISIILSPLRSFEFKEENITSLYQFLVNNPGIASNFIITTFLAIIITLFYFAILEFKLKQTLGKLIMQIEVKPLTRELSFSQAIVRNITKISTLVLLIDYMYAVINHTNQRFFEKISNTEVVETWAR